MNDLLLRACRREPVPRPPVWLMRQAGRYLPEYRAVRARVDFLTMVRTPELAVEVTLQPVNLLGVDAAILFSDILVVPAGLGMRLSMEEGTGPVLHDPLRRTSDLDRLRPFEPEEALPWQLEAIRLARRALDGRVPLIGFAGAPWTLASYMIEGGASRDFRHARRFLAEAPEAAHRLLDLLAHQVGRCLVAQAQAGAQVLQVFDSWAGALGPRDFAEFCLPYLARVVRTARTAGVPVIAFALGAGWALEAIARETGADVLGIDWQADPADARRRLAPFPVACQGNLDPGWLYARPDVIRERVAAMVRGFGVQGYIANLGHGVLRDTPIKHVHAFVRAVQEGEA
jgi:uroporphyrinogen decarboxylase